MLVAVVLPFTTTVVRAQSDDTSGGWQTWGAASDTLTAGPPGQRLLLRSPFIAAESERVWVDGARLMPGQYEFNYQRGMLRITTPVPEGAVIVVDYRRLPFLLNSMYSLRNVQFADVRPGQPQELIPPRQREGYFNPTGNLVFGGMKSISFSFGSRKGTELDQTLQVSVEGQLTNSIKVKALLSDNNLPIQPEGNTADLEYIDKVYVEISGTNGRATMGDFGFQNNYSDFNQFSRELKGVSGEVFGAGSLVGAAAGSAKGVFRNVTFRGTEQLQGPYELLPAGRTNGEVIIAGTERVYFNGLELQRGQNRDYVIDYDNGTVTFTPRRLVTVDTEISVDFEATQEQYNRTSVFGVGRTTKVPGQFEFQALVASEEDDPDRPKSVTLSDDDRRIIADAGDDTGAAIANGATFVGAGEGKYDLVPADTIVGLPDRYVFNDSTGSWDVLFYEVGGGRGDYVLDGITQQGLPFYRFVPGSSGNYRIGRPLPLPQSHTVVTSRLVRKGRVEVDAQYNVSDFDANKLSAIGDGDNVGDAGELRLGLNAIPVGVGEVDLKGSLSTIEENFRSLQRTRSSYFYRDWNLERDTLVGREVLQSFTSTFRREDAVRVAYELGAIRRDNFDGVKNEGRLVMAAGEDRRLSGRAFDTNLNGEDERRTRRHGSVDANYGVWKLLPSAFLSSERYLAASPVLPDSGIAYVNYGVKLAKRKVDRFGFSLEFDRRATQQQADTTAGWIDTRTDRTLRGSLLARRFSGIQGELEISHREQDNLLVGDTQTSDLARLKTQFQTTRAGLRGNVDYEISQNQFRAQQKSVVFVGEGQGDYNELGEPVGKGRGAYTLVLQPTLATIPTHTVNLAFRFSWKAPPKTADAMGPFTWIGRNVSLAQQLVVRDESQSDQAYKTYLLFPSALQRDDTTVRGIVSLLQDWSLLNDYPNVSLTFRYQRDDEEDNSFPGVNENKFFQQQIARVERTLTASLSGNLEGTRELQRRNGQGLPTGTGSTYDVTGWALAAGFGMRFSAGSSLDGQLEYRIRDDAESSAEERSIAFRPRLVWRLNKFTNVFARYEVTSFSDGGTLLVRPFFFSAPGTTHRWSLTPNVRISKYISVVAAYEGRSEDTFSGSRVTEHDFRIETRAFF